MLFANLTEPIQPSDTLDKDQWQTLMFDSEFKVSETYFSVLQMLRIFNEWIEQTESEWSLLLRRVRHAYVHRKSKSAGGWSSSRSDTDRKILEEKLRDVEELMRHLASILKKRIEKKRIEVESLRDGVSIQLSSRS